MSKHYSVFPQSILLLLSLLLICRCCSCRRFRVSFGIGGLFAGSVPAPDVGLTLPLKEGLTGVSLSNNFFSLFVAVASIPTVASSCFNSGTIILDGTSNFGTITVVVSEVVAKILVTVGHSVLIVLLVVSVLNVELHSTEVGASGEVCVDVGPVQTTLLVIIPPDIFADVLIVGEQAPGDLFLRAAIAEYGLPL